MSTATAKTITFPNSGTGSAGSFIWNAPNIFRYNWGFGNFDDNPLKQTTQRGDDINQEYIISYNYSSLYKKNKFGYYIPTGVSVSSSFGVNSGGAAVLTNSFAEIGFVGYTAGSPFGFIFNVRFKDFNGTLLGTSTNITTSATLTAIPGNFFTAHATSIGNTIYLYTNGSGIGPQKLFIINTNGTNSATLVNEYTSTVPSIDFLQGILKLSTSNTNILVKSSGDVYDYTTGTLIQNVNLNNAVNIVNAGLPQQVGVYIKYNSDYLYINPMDQSLASPSLGWNTCQQFEFTGTVLI